MSKSVLVTGGAGYVGSHCCKAFSRSGWNVIVMDNLSRGWRDAVRWGPLIECDIADSDRVQAALEQYRPDLVAHFAAFAYVNESVSDPERYYTNNTAGTLALLKAMRAVGCHSLLFSSTCATYGNPITVPINEAHPQHPINPYGWSKLFIERIVEDFGRAYNLRSVMLRYFNAAGCDPEGELGERHEPETHAVPLVIDAVLRADRPFTIFGTDFPTRDGTAVRDYVHVSDLADAHVLAGESLLKQGGTHVYNLGAGTGTSIRELIDVVRRVAKRDPLIRNGSRREGDPAELVSAVAKAERELGWKPKHSRIEFIVETALKSRERTLAD